MTCVDSIFKRNIRRILNEGTFDENPRPRYESDGKPAYSKYITSVYEEYDISKNQFPITTLRPIAWESAIKEIFWIYKDQTASLGVLEGKYNIHWWRQWEVGKSSGIGQRYGTTVKRYNLMNKLLHGLKNNPYSRRHIMSLWQNTDLEETEGLYPCAYSTTWSVRNIDGIKYL